MVKEKDIEQLAMGLTNRMYYSDGPQATVLGLDASEVYAVIKDGLREVLEMEMNDRARGSAAARCTHKTWEKESAFADGYCPLCCAVQNKELRAVNEHSLEVLEYALHLLGFNKIIEAAIARARTQQ